LQCKIIINPSFEIKSKTFIIYQYKLFSMEHVKKYIDANKDRFLSELFELIRIPSISSIQDHKDDMLRTAELWKKFIIEAGADRAEVMPSEGNPVVYGEKIVDPNKPTVLVYGHYDVMPVDPIEAWESDPFKPEIRDGKIFARGADDDKGQAFMHAKAFELMVKTNTEATPKIFNFLMIPSPQIFCCYIFQQG
jgi:acetylornithine deacetylase/succinyl-diaminopimelate desuccinylase-like protein